MVRRLRETASPQIVSMSHDSMNHLTKPELSFFFFASPLPLRRTRVAYLNRREEALGHLRASGDLLKTRYQTGRLALVHFSSEQIELTPISAASEQIELTPISADTNIRQYPRDRKPRRRRVRDLYETQTVQVLLSASSWTSTERLQRWLHSYARIQHQTLKAAQG
jgi:hypothetical protein